MKIGVTGHQRLVDESAWNWVKGALLDFLKAKTNLEGITCLAVGADQLFADCVRNSGGFLTAIIPFPDYSRTFQSRNDLENYERLLTSAGEVITMPGESDDEASYLKAGMRVVDESELVVAVWDGFPAKGKGGTGDIVEYALSSEKQVLQFCPLERQIKAILKS